MSDITLTAGIRQNLLSLQQTSAELTTTQEALATGKSVNSAADNPSAYFTSQNLTNTANSLSSLLDQIGQGLQTIDAATNGLTGITSLLQQALSTVQQAQSDSWTTAASSTGTVQFGFTGGTVTGTTAVTTATAANTLTIDAGTGTYNVAITSGTTLANIESAINTATGGAVTATDDGAGHLILTAGAGTSTFSVAADATLGVAASTATSTIDTTAASTLGAGSLTLEVGSTTYTVAVTADSSLATIEQDINNTTGLGSAGAVTATDDGNGHLVLTSNSAPTGFTIVDNTLAEGLGLTTAGNNTTPDGSSATRTTLQENYNGLLQQIDQMAVDSGYNGVNLIGGDNLVIDFNPTGTSSLTITGVTFNSSGLGLSAASGTTTKSFQDGTELSSLISALNSAITTVQNQTETFGTNSSTISTRQTFTTAMINTLQTGASNLVAADQNEESADLLTEQTQQQLEISALSIANQANQSVLKLFS